MKKLLLLSAAVIATAGFTTPLRAQVLSTDAGVSADLDADNSVSSTVVEMEAVADSEVEASHDSEMDAEAESSVSTDGENETDAETSVSVEANDDNLVETEAEMLRGETETRIQDIEDNVDSGVQGSATTRVDLR